MTRKNLHYAYPGTAWTEEFYRCTRVPGYPRVRPYFRSQRLGTNEDVQSGAAGSDTCILPLNFQRSNRIVWQKQSSFKISEVCSLISLIIDINNNKGAIKAPYPGTRTRPCPRSAHCPHRCRVALLRLAPRDAVAASACRLHVYTV
eukprot:96909-Rhodomonas_salina.1